MSLREELAEFLVRLGLTIEEEGEDFVRATRRTALRQETSEFQVGLGRRRRPRKGSTLIVPNDASPPALRPEEWLYFDDFLDRTIQSDRIASEARSLTFDPEVRKQLEVFVPQRIAEAGDPRPQDAVSYFFQEWLPNPLSRLLVVLGPAGYGKTLLTYQVARRLADAHLASHRTPSPPRQPLPFLVPFGRFRRVAEFEGMILTSLQRRGITDFTPGAFADLVGRRRVVLFLDGFDELLEERPTEAQRNLREFIETVKGEGKVIITARSTFFRTSLDVADFLEHDLSSEDVTVIDLRPFDAAQRKEVVQRLSPNQTTINRVAQVVEAPQIREAMGSPLLLRETIEALVAGSVDLKGTPSRRDLFTTLEKSVYERERNRHAHLFNDETQRMMLRILAGEILRENVRGFDMDLVKVAAAEAIRNGEAAEAELDKLADHHFLNVDSESDDVRFNHQVFREYFQALSLVDALQREDQQWVVTILNRRPIPEEVAEFFAEIAEPGHVESLLACLSDSGPNSQLLVNNIGSICAAFSDAKLLSRFLEVSDPSVPLTLRVEGFDVNDVDFSNRQFDLVGFTRSSLANADFSRSVVAQAAFNDCDLKDTRFEDAEINSASFDHGIRVFGSAPILRLLADRGAYCGPDFEKRLEVLTVSYRDRVLDIVKGRFRRFYVPGRTGPAGSRWDTAIKEKSLLGGIDQPTRSFVVGALIPDMLRLGILERRREHGDFIYRLEDIGKDDARSLLEQDRVTGVVKELVDRLVDADRWLR